MYNKVQFGHELKERVAKKQDVAKIGAWAYEIFLNYSDSFDDIFLNMLITLNTMELGPEFVFKYEELNKIADDLIIGKEVHLN